MTGLRAGVLLAALVAGPPLWSLVRSGELDGTSAITRAALVAAACAIAASWIGRLLHGYEADSRRRQREELAAQVRKALDQPGRPPSP